MADITITITVDALDAEKMAAFWAGALHYVPVGGANQYLAIGPPDGETGPKLLFQGVDTVSTGKNRWHIDLDLGAVDLQAEIDRLLALGATLAEPARTEEFDLSWQIMADPEGNVFCVTDHPGAG